MPLTARELITERGRNRELFFGHLVPQMDHLRSNILEIIKNLNAERPRDDARIKGFQSMADALQIAAHSSESRFTREATLQNALNTLRQSADFLKEDDAKNLRLLQGEEKKHPEFQSRLHEQDQEKNVLDHLRDISGFFGFGYTDIADNREIQEARENFLGKLDTDQQYFINYIGRQAAFLRHLLETAREDLIKDGSTDSDRLRKLERVGNALRGLVARGNIVDDDRNVERNLNILKELPSLLSENDGQNIALFRETLANHPDLLDYLPDQYRDQKNLIEHIEDVGGYFNLRFGAAGNKLLAKHKAELQEEAAAREQKRLDVEEANIIDRLRQESLADRMEDQEEADREEAAKKQEREDAQLLKEQQQSFRNQMGPFVMPEAFDNRDAAGMILNSAKQNGTQFRALASFRNRLQEELQGYNTYAGTEYAKRLPQAMENLPENPTEEQRAQAIDEAIRAIPPEEREQQLRTYFPDYEARLQEEREKLGDAAPAGQAEMNLFREALIDQYRIDALQKQYPAEQIKKAQREASIELAREKMANADQQTKDLFEQNRTQKTYDLIARQVKNQILNAYRGIQNQYLAARFPNEVTKRQYIYSHRSNPAFQKYLLSASNLNTPDFEKALFEASLGGLLDLALTEKKDWDGLNQMLEGYGVPKELADPEKKAGPLDIALKKAQEGNAAALVEEEMLLDEAALIPESEIEKRMYEKLPVGQDPQNLLYQWACDQKKEKLKEQISKERDQKYPDIANTGADVLIELCDAADKIVTACTNLEIGPEPDEKEPQKIDYKEELRKDKNLSPDQRRMLGQEFDKYQEELRIEQLRKQNGKAMIKEDREFMKQEEQKAALRMGMSEKERRAERIQTAIEKREQEKRRRLFLKDFKKRLKEADQEKREKIEAGKNKKIKGNLDKFGDWTAAVYKNLKLCKFKDDGTLGKAYGKLDKEFTQADLRGGKDLRVKMGVAPEEKKVQPQAVPKKEKEPENQKVRKGIVETKTAAQKLQAKKVKKKVYVFTEDYRKLQQQREIEAQQKAAAAAEKKLREDNKALNTVRRDELKNQMDLNWNSLIGGGVTRAMRQAHISKLLAMKELLGETQLTDDPALLSGEKINEKAEKIMNSAAFKKLFAKGAPNYLREPNANKLIHDYEKNVELINTYRIPAEQQEKFAARLAPVVQAMEETYSGKIAKFVPRGPLGNSSAYKNALATIRSARDQKAEMTSDEIYTTTETVLKYLEGKESKRIRGFGQVRWNQCMTFLKYTMPPAEFQKYCDHVNEARGLTGKPNHEDYITPERFGSSNYAEAIDEVKDQIERGDNRAEDYATMAALRMLDASQPVDRLQLQQARQSILQDENFQFLMQPENLGALHERLVTQGNAGYADLANNIRNQAQAHNQINK